MSPSPGAIRIVPTLATMSPTIAVREGGDAGLTSAELVPHAYDDASPAVWPIAKLSIDAHFEKLEREGRIARAGRPDAFRVVR